MYKATFTCALALLLLLNTLTSANAFSYPDVPIGHPAYQDIARIITIGMPHGFPDGTYRPDENLTRGELARYVVLFAGLLEVAEQLKSTPSPFNDVSTGAWNNGFIIVASSQGLMEGDENSYFRQYDMATYSEVVTALLCLLGYNDNLPGDSPVDYIAKAATLGIFENMQFSGSEPITRGDLAILMSRSLDQRIVEYDSNNGIFINPPDKTNLLIENFFKPLSRDYGKNKYRNYLKEVAAIAKLIR